MLKDQVIIGGEYVAKINNWMTVVKITSVSPYGGWNAVNMHTKREVRIRTAAKLRTPNSKWVMSLQPKSPEELDSKPFVCIRCAHPMAPGKEGFITSFGFPVHVACGKVGELQEYKDANDGNGWKLNQKYFAAWYADDQITPVSDGVMLAWHWALDDDAVLSVLAKYGDLTRKQIAAGTKLMEEKVNNAIDRLIDAKLVGHVGISVYFRKLVGKLRYSA